MITGALVALGAIGAGNVIINGEHAMGTTNQVPWGALIAAYVFFVVSSTGLCLVSSLGHVFHIERFEVVGKRAVLFAIITLLCGFGVIGLELGNPFHMIWIAFSPNFTSAIWWMGFLYSIYLVLLIFEFMSMLKEDHKGARLYGTLAFISAIAAHSNLGAVFGFLHARPYWQGPYMAIYFILSAFLSGAAILAIIFYLVDKNGGQARYKGEPIVTHLGKLMALALGITMFFTTWKILTGLYGAAPGKYEAVLAVLTGPLAWKFWIFEVGMGMVFPFLILMRAGGFETKKVYTAAMMTIIGIFFMRLDLVYAGQIIPLKVVDGLKGVVNLYTPSWSEWAIIFGAIGASILALIVGEQKFSLDVKADGHGHASPAGNTKGQLGF